LSGVFFESLSGVGTRFDSATAAFDFSFPFATLAFAAGVGVADLAFPAGFGVVVGVLTVLEGPKNLFQRKFITRDDHSTRGRVRANSVTPRELQSIGGKTDSRGGSAQAVLEKPSLLRLCGPLRGRRWAGSRSGANYDSGQQVDWIQPKTHGDGDRSISLPVALGLQSRHLGTTSGTR
jgi:hypothetical protein